MNRYTSLFRTNSITGPGVIVFLITLLIILGFGNNAHGGTISQTPLYLTLEGVDPNIMVIVDDSGSMGWDYLPDAVGSISGARRYSSTVNKIYYNPAIVYKPPLNSDGTSFPNATFSGARSNGYNSSSSTVNLSGSVYYVYRGDTIPLPSDCNGTINDNDCYQSVTVSATSGPSGTDETTNFANWYSYYRYRIYTAKAGISRAFGPQGYDLRVGYGRINDSNSTTIDGKSVTTIARGVRPFLDASTTVKERSDFFTWLYGLTANGYTPLRRALDAAGLYYENSNSKGPWADNPGTGGNILSCRQSYTILMTDGYWNSGQAATGDARADNDGTAGPTTIIGPSPTCTGLDCQTFTYEAVSPFIDAATTSPKTNTLADIAMYYWKRDLLPTINNRVPTNSLDPAFWQHMVVFGIGLGVPTVIDPDAAFNAINTGASIPWPNPRTDNTEEGASVPARIDDLLHASVNSRGGFFNAQDPDEFATQLQQILEDIISREASSSSAAPTTSPDLQSDPDHPTLVFRAEFDPRDWSGRVRAYEFNDNGVLKPIPKWDTDNTTTSPIPIPVYDDRNIYTLNGSNKVSFVWNFLNLAQQTALNTLGSVVSDDEVGKNRLKWIRGDRENEEDHPAGTLRTRNKLLGDIVNSDPLYVEGASSKTLYVGANDGMLHAFNALTGNEEFAYIPTVVFPNLSRLTDPKYAHKYFVDGSPVYQKLPDGRLILVGTTGAGGRSVFALNVTDPGSFSVLWELTNATHPDLGCAIGKPQIGQLKNGTWVAIFGNGYNSGSTKRCDEIPPNPDPSQAFLFVVNLTSGAVIAKIPAHADTANGLSTPTLLPDSSNDGRIIAAYAGDLKGHLVKFDLTTNTVAFNAPLFTARNASNAVQPITAAPEIARHTTNGGYLIFFGTGKYYEVDDHTASGVPTQSLYGIWDTATFASGAWQGGTAITSTNRSVLLQQTIIGEKMEAGNKWRLTSKNSIDWTSHRGWYLDLTTAGERVTYQAESRPDTQVVIFETRIPYNATDPCIPSVGTSWFITVDMLTGGRPTKAVLDVNRDSMFDQYDTIELNGELMVVSGFEMAAAGIGRTTLIQFAPGIIDIIQSGTSELATTAEAYSNPTAQALADAAKAAAQAAAKAAAQAAAAQAAADQAQTAADQAQTAADQAQALADAAPGDAALQAAAAAAAAAAQAAATVATDTAAVATAATSQASTDISAAAQAIIALAGTIPPSGGVVSAAEAQAIIAAAQAIVAQANSGVVSELLIRDLLMRAAPLLGRGDTGVRLAGELGGGVVPDRTWRQLQ